ncbi:MAG: PRC-barrel domain-containing protein [Aestuariivirga sp.]
MNRHLLATTALAVFVSTAGVAAQAATTAVDQAQITDSHLASNIIGKKVYNSSDDNAASIGSVDDVLINKTGGVESVIIGVGGFLGIGEKDVAVPYNTVKWVEKNGERWLVISSNSDQLKAQAAFDRKAYDVATAAVNNTNTAGVAPSANAKANTTIAAADKTSMSPVDPGKIRAEELVGTTVYGANDERVGEIGDLVLTKDSKIDAVIMDVGGFLGMGEKEVAVGMDKLKFMEDKSGKRYLYTNFTKEQLKAQPAYDKTTWMDKRDSQRLVTQ